MVRLVAIMCFVIGCGRLHFDPLSGGSGDGDAQPGNGDGSGIPSDSRITASDANLVFVTSTTQTLSALGGLAGGDAACQARAMAAGLAGSYVAFLSTTTVSARSRIEGARGWVRTDGAAFADDVPSLFGGTMFYPPAVDEFGQRVPDNTVVATGSSTSGMLGDANCNDWTAVSGARVGRPLSGRSTWINLVVGGCGASRIYCFGVDRMTPVAPPPPSGRRAFVAPGFTPGGGLAAADALCASAASAASLPGTYRALLATSGATAASRVTLGTWFRVDGVRFTTDLVTLDSPLRIAADGAVLDTDVWFGAADPFTAGAGSTTCNGWASTGGNGTAGSNEYATATSFAYANQQGCGTSLGIYCLEE